jgi:hypothetical protein
MGVEEMGINMKDMLGNLFQAAANDEKCGSTRPWST